MDVTRTFPEEERFGLTSQLRRRSVSISFNIGEGSSRSSVADFSRFSEIAYGSLLESVSELNIGPKSTISWQRGVRECLQRSSGRPRLELRARVESSSRLGV